jgi:hypothetical protein
LSAEIAYQVPHQPPPVALETFSDGGITVTVRPPALIGLLPRLLPRRLGQSLVIGISPRSIYVQDPRRWIAPRRFYRHTQLEHLSVLRYDVRYRGWRTGEHFYRLELHIRFERPLVIMEARMPHELLQICNQLRAALKLPPEAGPLTAREANKQLTIQGGRRAGAG